MSLTLTLTLYVFYTHYCVHGSVSVIDSITPELYILDSTGNQRRSNDVALPFNSHVTLICRTSSTDANLSWQFAVVDSNDFRSVTESEHLLIDHSKSGETVLQLKKVRFPMAGTYQCSNKITGTQVNVHVYGILNAISSTVHLISKTGMAGKVQFHTHIFDPSTRPTLACQFRVGRSGVKYTTVRWTGGKYTTHPDLYQLTYSADEINGLIWSNLSIIRPTFDPELYGKYQCLFNIVPGSMESAELELSVAPIIRKTDEISSYVSGKRFSHHCAVVAYPPIDSPVMWSRDEQPVEFDEDGKPYVAGIDWAGRVRIETQVNPNDRIVFDPVWPEDRAVYSCFVRSSIGNATGVFYMRVKDRWTFLWPLIGILVEVSILFVIILVYEINRRKRAKSLGGDNRNGPETNSAVAYGHTDVSQETALRHRPTRV